MSSKPGTKTFQTDVEFKRWFHSTNHAHLSTQEDKSKNNKKKIPLEIPLLYTELWMDTVYKKLFINILPIISMIASQNTKSKDQS